jgi:hypothetical protein
MAKPILIVKTPKDYTEERMEAVDKTLHRNELVSNDYHIFVITGVTNTFDFKVFNGDYSTEQYTSLETFIEELNK